jgi:uncharacterized protein
MIKIILDTNFLMIPFALKVDIFSEIDRLLDDEYGLFIMDKTQTELDRIISTQRGKHRQAASFAKQLLEKKKIQVIIGETDGNVDDDIVSIAGKERIIVGTQDRGLKRRVKETGGSVIALRQKSHLILVP